MQGKEQSDSVKSVYSVNNSDNSDLKNNINNKFHINNFILRAPKRQSTQSSDSESEHSPDKLPCSVPITMAQTSDNNSAPVQQNTEQSDQCNLKNIIINSDSRTTSYKIPTKNRFTVLQSNNDEGMETENEDDNTNNKRKKLPPPIILHGQAGNHKQLVTEIKNHIKDDFNIKYTRNNVNLTINNSAERENYLNYLKNHNVSFHTYTNKNDKTHAFVVRGLANDVEPKELGEYISTNYNIKVINCYKMKFNPKEGQRYTPNTLFLLVTDNTITLRTISARIKYILHTRVYFELRRNNRRITQCHNCQMWGHATSNCYAPTRCLFCAENHKTQTCDQKDKIKCANCKGKHQANDTSCQHYQERLKWIENSSPPQRNERTRENNQYRDRDYPRFVPAPIPAQNAWTQRTSQQQTAPTQERDQQREQQHQQHSQATQSTSRPSTFTGRPPTTFQKPTDTDTFKQITQQFKQLHSMVNMQALLQAVTDLNTQIQTCTSKSEIFQTFTEFIEHIDDYDI